MGSIQMRPDGNVLLRHSGISGATYHVEATTNSSSWRELGISTATNGDYQFLDITGHNSPLKLYRLWKSE